MPRVIYLTGAPATGKSTLSKELKKRIPNLEVFSYSAELRDYVGQRMQGKVLTEEDIRKNSAVIITRADVEAVDEKLVAYVKSHRARKNIIIDSHPVTKESYGFRVTPFSRSMLEALFPDVILCLYVDSEIATDRIKADPAGRPLPSHSELDIHQHLQSSVAIQYGLLLDKPVYFLNGAAGSSELATIAVERAGLSLQ